jgi:hypothetical protein
MPIFEEKMIIGTKDGRASTVSWRVLNLLKLTRMSEKWRQTQEADAARP